MVSKKKKVKTTSWSASIEKKGISPLIATVLVIGFVVALAAVIMTWGTSFTKNIQESTEEGATSQIVCAQDVVFKITSVCQTATLGTYKLVVQNDGTKDIDKFNARFFEADDDVTQREVVFPTSGNGVSAFGIESDTSDSGQQDDGTSLVKKIEVIPVVTVNNKPLTCSANVKAFGSLDGNPIPNCT